jgi:hypothetical protein
MAKSVARDIGKTLGGAAGMVVEGGGRMIKEAGQGVVGAAKGVYDAGVRTAVGAQYGYQEGVRKERVKEGLQNVGKGVKRMGNYVKNEFPVNKNVGAALENAYLAARAKSPTVDQAIMNGVKAYGREWVKGAKIVNNAVGSAGKAVYAQSLKEGEKLRKRISREQ